MNATDRCGRVRPSARALRAFALLLLLALLLGALVSCSPRGVYTNALGASYRFRAWGRYTHTDAAGTVTGGRYSIEGDTITFSPRGADSFSMPYQKRGDTLIIGDIYYEKE